MPCTCDNSELDRSFDYGYSSPSSRTPERVENQQHRARLSTKSRRNDIDSSTPTIITLSDKGNSACSISHSSQSSDCTSTDHKENNSCTVSRCQPDLFSIDSSKHCFTAETFFGTSRQEANSLLKDGSNAPLALTTRTINDQGQPLPYNSKSNIQHHNIREKNQFSKTTTMHSLREKSPVSMSDLIIDLPKAAISLGEKRNNFPSSPPILPSNALALASDDDNMHHHDHDVKRAHIIEDNETLRAITSDMKRHHFNPHSILTDKVSPKTAHSSMLYSLLHCPTSNRDHYNNTSVESGYDHSVSKYDPAHFYGRSPSSSSSLTRPRWSQDVIMKSSPELCSYFNHRSPHHAIERSRARTFSCKADSLFVSSSQGRGGDIMTNFGGSPYSSSNILVNPETLSSRSSSPLPFPTHMNRYNSPSILVRNHDEMELHSSDRDSTAATSTPPHTAARLTIKREDRLSPGGLSSQRHPSSSSSSSPYNMYSSLSPWSAESCSSSDFCHSSSDTLGTPIKEKIKCASDSSLYLPNMVQSPLSPALSSSIPTSEESVVVGCRWKMCTQTFTSQKALAQHVNDCHVRIERPDVDFQCHWQGCPRQGKGFNARYKMLIHIRTHTNEKPHKCAVCRKCFSRLENLKIHMRSHTGEKPYACTFPGCTKAYSNSSDRFKHVRTHQEEKPYKCKMAGCHKQYTDPSSLRKHVRTHGHGTKFAQSPLRRAMSGIDGMQMNDTKDFNKQNDHHHHLLMSRRHSIDVQDDLNEGLEKDADRQLKQSQRLDGGQSETMDIQRNIEFYSSLEVKSGIQKFGLIENSVREDLEPSVSCQQQIKTERMTMEETSKISSCSPPTNFDQRVCPNSRQSFLSVPSIIIEEANDNYKPVEKRDQEDEYHDKVFLDSRGVKRKFEDLREEKLIFRYSSSNSSSNSNSTTISSTGISTNITSSANREDLRISHINSMLDDDNVIGQTKLEWEEMKSSTVSSQDLNVSNDKVTSPSTPTTPVSPPTKHWKKRKILDEERLSQQKQEEEEEKKAAEDEQRKLIEKAQNEKEKLSSSRCQSPHPNIDTFNKRINLAHHSRLSPSEVNELSDHLLRSMASSSHHANTSSPFLISPNQLFESRTSPTPSMMSHHYTTSTLASIDSPHYPPPSSRLYLPTPHPTLCCSPLPHHHSSYNNPSTLPNPHHRHHSSPLPPLLPPSILYGYPELYSAQSKFETSLSSLSAATAAAMLFPKAEKSCRNIYVPYLSTLMDLSSGLSSLDSVPRHSHPPPHPHLQHPLSSSSLATHHHSVVGNATTLLHPVGRSPVARALP